MGHSFLFGDHKMVFFILRLIERKLSIQARLRGYLRQLLPVIYYQGKDSGGFVIKKLRLRLEISYFERLCRDFMS